MSDTAPNPHGSDYADGLRDGGYLALNAVASMLDAQGETVAADAIRMTLTNSYPPARA